MQISWIKRDTCYISFQKVDNNIKQIRLHDILIIFYKHFSVCIVSSKTRFLSIQIYLAI